MSITVNKIAMVRVKPFSIFIKVNTDDKMHDPTVEMMHDPAVEADDFEIIGKLGQGAFGSVFSAIWKNKMIKCAIKKMDLKKIEEEGR